MGKQEGADAHGPAGARSPRGNTNKWYPQPERENPPFDQAKADRDAQRNQGRGGK